MYDWNFVWFLMWVTSVILFTAAVLVVVFLIVWVLVRRAWDELMYRRLHRMIDREDAARTAEWQARSTLEQQE